MNENVFFVIFGSGGHSRVLIDIARSIQVCVSGLIDDSPKVDEVEGIQVLPSEGLDYSRFGPFRFISGIGNNTFRSRAFNHLLGFGLPINLIHPFTFISTHARIGRGIAIMPGVVINTGAEVGDNCILNTSCSIDHDCVIHPHVHICPGVRLAGNVTVGVGSMLGTGSCVIPGVVIGKNCLIGAGSVVVRDIPDHSVAFGNPARILRPNAPAFV